ncbi:2-keto-4-pentenoate hydratase [Roseicella aerolata]|uniref:Fumarylacetoacetate hydrolase family protein n=1 Tax=Roseicella aerolata TaxID=2883479 RepID=A0A9X1IDF8_9PROT|nr:fumarylacetoacetate hydrolase family protein [Roseicella aerolata]MCB4821263.1 fumarylacetoacetate hydrolase family protein [Roseicella aerolata]
MTDSIIEQAADLLVAIRRGAPKLAGLGAAAPRTEAEAWAVQREVLRRLGATAGGWKCAAPPGKPASGAMLDAAGLRPAPARWPVPPGQKIGIETEIAFRLGRGLPKRATPYAREEVLDAVAAAFPAMEMVESRYLDPAAVSPLEAMADSIAHAGLVLGADVPGWRGMDLAGLTVRQTCGGAVQVEKVGGNPSGDPVTPLVWLANHLPTLGLQLEAGQVVTTGSCTGLLWVDGGQRVTGGFAGFGEVVVDLD